MKKSAKNTNFDIKIVAKGIDSLYLYLDCEGVIKWEFIQNKIKKKETPSSLAVAATRVQCRVSSHQETGAKSQYQLPIQACQEMCDKLAGCPGFGL